MASEILRAGEQAPIYWGPVESSVGGLTLYPWAARELPDAFTAACSAVEVAGMVAGRTWAAGGGARVGG